MSWREWLYSPANPNRIAGSNQSNAATPGATSTPRPVANQLASNQSRPGLLDTVAQHAPSMAANFAAGKILTSAGLEGASLLNPGSWGNAGAGFNAAGVAGLAPVLNLAALGFSIMPMLSQRNNTAGFQVYDRPGYTFAGRRPGGLITSESGDTGDPYGMVEQGSFTAGRSYSAGNGVTDTPYQQRIPGYVRPTGIDAIDAQDVGWELDSSALLDAINTQPQFSLQESEPDSGSIAMPTYTANMRTLETPFSTLVYDAGGDSDPFNLMLTNGYAQIDTAIAEVLTEEELQAVKDAFDSGVAWESQTWKVSDQSTPQEIAKEMLLARVKFITDAAGRPDIYDAFEQSMNAAEEQVPSDSTDPAGGAPQDTSGSTSGSSLSGYYNPFRR